MKSRIYGVLCFFVFLVIVCGQKEPVKLIYFVEHTVEEEEDFIEISLEIKA
jgi:hypothetical protein